MSFSNEPADKKGEVEEKDKDKRNTDSVNSNGPLLLEPNLTSPNRFDEDDDSQIAREIESSPAS